MSKRKRGKGGGKKRAKKHGKKPRSLRPKSGATILHCGHLDKADTSKFHWWHLGYARQFVRADGTEGESEWVTACEPCFLVAKGQCLLVNILGDGVWGDSENVPFDLPPGEVPQIRQRLN